MRRDAVLAQSARSDHELDPEALVHPRDLSTGVPSTSWQTPAIRVRIRPGRRDVRRTWHRSGRMNVTRLFVAVLAAGILGAGVTLVVGQGIPGGPPATSAQP